MIQHSWRWTKSMAARQKAFYLMPPPATSTRWGGTWKATPYLSPVVCHHSHETYFLCLIKEGQYMAVCARLSLLDCLSWLLQKTCICFDTSPPAACLSQMRNKRRCVWSQNYLWAKRRTASRKTIRNSQPDTTILHLPTPFTENPQKNCL